MTNVNANGDIDDDINQNTLEELVRAIEWSGRQFTLILARCNYASLRSHLMERLRTMCSMEIREVVLDSSVKNLYTTIQAELNGDQPQVLILYGLESIMTLDPLLTGANQVREEFRKNFNFPLVCWVTDDVLRQLIRLAPDFYSWSNAVEFTSSSNKLISFIQETADRVFNQVLDVGAGIYLDDITLSLIGSPLRTELESARKDLQKCHANLDPELESNLEFVMGRAINNSPEHARQHYERSLTLLQQQQSSQQSNIPNQKLIERQGCLCYCIAISWYTDAQRHPDKCNQSYNLVKDYAQQGIEIFERAQRPELVAKFINGLGEVLKRLQQWDQLEVVATQALALHQTYPNLFRLARAYGFLAEAALVKSAWNEAKQLSQQALKSLKNAQLNISTPSSIEQNANLDWAVSYHQGWYLLSLAQAQQGLGELKEYINTLELAKGLTKAQYDPKLYILILENLRDGYFKQGQYLKAFQIKQEQRSVEQQFSLRAFIGADRLRPRQQVTNPVLTLRESQETIPQEIAASGRQQDVEQLIERIGRTDHKLTVIYGQSGVGKSSILQAGLIPGLKQKSIGTRDILVVFQRIYTDWIKGNSRALTEAIQEKKDIKFNSNLDSTDAIITQLKINGNKDLLSVLIFDQFEEFFFICKQPKQRQVFYNFLQQCLEIEYVKIIFALREDYIHYLLELNRLVNLDVINKNILDKNILYYLGNFSRENAKSVIENLTDKAHLNLEEQLIEKLVEDLTSELNEVRPIELQVVGAQIQTEVITTLAKYQELGPKEALVQRYLEEVIKDCGHENKRIAQLVLYLLTDENNTRPPKTRPELEGALKGLTSELAEEIEKLDLVLNIFVSSGLVVLIQELPAHRYQLIHDYLVVFIRQEQSSELIEKLKLSEELRKRSEAKLNQFLKWALVGSIMSVVLLFNLGLQAKREEIKSVTLLSRLLLATNHELDALIESLKASRQLNGILGRLAFYNSESNDNTNQKLESVLQEAIYKVVEQNRLEKHEKEVKYVSFSPDGQIIATASGDETVKLWSLDGQEIKTLKGHKGLVNSVNFSPDGQTIATASWDKTVKLWNRDGTEIKILNGHNGGVNSVNFSSDGQMIATASEDKTVKLWNRDGTEIKILNGHNGGVNSVNFSPDGQTIATASEDGTVKLWNRDGTEIKTLKVHNDGDPGESGVWSVSFSPDSNTIATASKDKKVQLWSLDGKESKVIGYHNDPVTSVSFSPDGRMIATASSDRTVKLWNRDGKELQTLKGHTDWVWSINFSPDSQIIASASKDNTVKLWKVAKRNLQIIPAHNGAIYSVSFSPDGQTIATASGDKSVQLWNRNGQKIQTFNRYDSGVTDISFSPDGQTIATATENKIVKLWTKNGKELQTIDAHENWIWSVSFSPDSQTIATASAGTLDHTVKLWTWNSIDKKFQLFKALEGHKDKVNSVSFSPDGQTIATASWDKTVKLWNRDGKKQQTLNSHQDGVHSVSFSPDGQTIVTASEDKTVKVWNRNGKELQTIKGHDAGVFKISVSPDSQTIATASLDGTVKLWSKDGRELRTFTGHEDAVFSLSFSPDGQIIASSDRTGKLILWNLDLTVDDLQRQGCDWIRDYLKNNSNVQSDRHLCDGIKSQN
jgi:WD40 repeat protein